MEIDLAGRSVKGQLKQANRLKASHVLTPGEEGAVSLQATGAGQVQEVSTSEVLELIRRS